MLENANEIFFSITFFDLKKGPNIEKNLLATFLDNLKPINLKILTTEKDYMKIPEEFKKEIDFIAIDLIIQNEEKFIELLNN